MQVKIYIITEEKRNFLFINLIISNILNKISSTQMKVVFAFLLLTYVLASSDWGFCPNVSIQADFDFERHTGNWYEIVKSKNLLSLEKGNFT